MAVPIVLLPAAAAAALAAGAVVLHDPKLRGTFNEYVQQAYDAVVNLRGKGLDLFSPSSSYSDYVSTNEGTQMELPLMGQPVTIPYSPKEIDPTNPSEVFDWTEEQYANSFEMYSSEWFQKQWLESGLSADDYISQVADQMDQLYAWSSSVASQVQDSVVPTVPEVDDSSKSSDEDKDKLSTAAQDAASKIAGAINDAATDLSSFDGVQSLDDLVDKPIKLANGDILTITNVTKGGQVSDSWSEALSDYLTSSAGGQFLIDLGISKGQLVKQVAGGTAGKSWKYGRWGSLIYDLYESNAIQMARKAWPFIPKDPDLFIPTAVALVRSLRFNNGVVSVSLPEFLVNVSGSNQFRTAFVREMDKTWDQVYPWLESSYGAAVAEWIRTHLQLGDLVDVDSVRVHVERPPQYKPPVIPKLKFEAWKPELSLPEWPTIDVEVIDSEWACESEVERVCKGRILAWMKRGGEGDPPVDKKCRHRYQTFLQELQSRRLPDGEASPVQQKE